MKANEYQELVMRTCTNGAHESLMLKVNGTQLVDIPLVLNAALGLSGEVGELNDMIKKYIYHGHKMDEQAFNHELGDICWYLAMMCKATGNDLEKIMAMNIDKLQKRYPEGFSEVRSINREEQSSIGAMNGMTEV